MGERKRTKEIERLRKKENKIKRNSEKESEKIGEQKRNRKRNTQREGGEKTRKRELKN